MTSIDNDTRFALAANVSLQQLGEGAVILRIDDGQLYTCNETTEAFINLIQQRLNFGAIVERLVLSFDVDQATCARDFRLIAEELVTQRIIEAC